MYYEYMKIGILPCLSVLYVNMTLHGNIVRWSCSSNATSNSFPITIEIIIIITKIFGPVVKVQ